MHVFGDHAGRVAQVMVEGYILVRVAEYSFEALRLQCRKLDLVQPVLLGEDQRSTPPGFHPLPSWQAGSWVSIAGAELGMVAPCTGKPGCKQLIALTSGP